MFSTHLLKRTELNVCSVFDNNNLSRCFSIVVPVIFFFAFFLFWRTLPYLPRPITSPSSPHPLRPWVACIASGPPQSFVGRRYKMAAKDGGLVFEETSEFKNPEEHFLPPGWEIRTMDDGRIYYAKWVFSRSLIRDFNLVLWKVLWGSVQKHLCPAYGCRFQYRNWVVIVIN